MSEGLTLGTTVQFATIQLTLARGIRGDLSREMPLPGNSDRQLSTSVENRNQWLYNGSNRRLSSGTHFATEL